MPGEARVGARTRTGFERMAVPLVLYHDHDGFRRWLDAELFRRFGRGKSNRSICIEARLPENALYRVLTRGDRGRMYREGASWLSSGRVGDLLG